MKTGIAGKKGDKIISVYWFAILFLVAAAVAYMVFSFYGAPKDVRKIEARMLTNHIANCLAEGGYLVKNIADANFKNNFLKECNLNFQVEDVYEWRSTGQYYILTEIYKFAQDAPNKLGRKVFDFSYGNLNLKEKDMTGRDFYAIDKLNNQYVIKIISIVGKNEKNSK